MLVATVGRARTYGNVLHGFADPISGRLTSRYGALPEGQCRWPRPRFCQFGLPHGTAPRPFARSADAATRTPGHLSRQGRCSESRQAADDLAETASARA